MSILHNIRIKPGSKQETKFMAIMDSVGVKDDLLICKPGYIFNTPFNEYILSDGLYRQVGSKVEVLQSRN